MTDRWFPTATDLRADGAQQEASHAEAARVTRASFGPEVFVRGVVEVSNFCRENCHYCSMRRDNRSLDRFRARHDELADLLVNHRPASITDINLQAGEDPLVVREVVIPLIRTLRQSTPLGISVCLGTLSRELFAGLHEAGATIYILKFELADADRYGVLEAPGTLSERTDCIRQLAGAGWSVSSGFIAGLPGQSDDEALGNFRLADSLPLVGCSVSPFIPGESTPLSAAPSGSIELTLNCMAALRRMRPEWVIPAVSALNLAQPGTGYRRGIRAGANLCTINLTPEGVRDDYLLYRRERFIMTEERILEAIASEGLRPSQTSLAAHYATRGA